MQWKDTYICEKVIVIVIVLNFKYWEEKYKKIKCSADFQFFIDKLSLSKIFSFLEVLPEERKKEKIYLP